MTIRDRTFDDVDWVFETEAEQLAFALQRNEDWAAGMSASDALAILTKTSGAIRSLLLGALGAFQSHLGREEKAGDREPERLTQLT